MATTIYDGHEISRLPAWNIRSEFAQICSDLRDDRTWSTLVSVPQTRVAVRIGKFYYATWLNEAITATYQRCFMGLEAYICYAVYAAGITLGKDRKRIIAAVRNPFGGPGYKKPQFTAAEKARNSRTSILFYDRLPALLNPTIALSTMDPLLSAEVDRMYSELRNPLFHGYQISRCGPAEVRQILGRFERTFSWIDGWFQPVEKAILEQVNTSSRLRASKVT